jgi:putative ABC transport system permease protein
MKPDYRAIVQREITALGLSTDRELKVVEELSQQIEEIHGSLVDNGLSDEAAAEETLRRLPPWTELRDDLLDAEPVLRMAHSERPPLPGKAKRALVSGLLRAYGSGLFVELRMSARRLWKSRGFTATAVLTLAICLGANAAIFSIVEQVLLTPLSVPEPDRIMLMANQFPNAGAGSGEMSAARNYFDRLEGVSAFTEQAMFASTDRVAGLGDGNTRVHGMTATPSFFRLVSVPPILGRAFQESEAEPGNDKSVILSHGLWQDAFGADREILDEQLRLDGVAYTIVGVMPAGFSFFDSDVRFWVPLAFTQGQRQNAVANSWFNIGRLAPDATAVQAQGEVDAVNRAFLDSIPPQLKNALENAGYHTTVEPLEEVLVRGYSRTLYLLWAAATVVLLIGGVNVANLTLARERLRYREMATRVAIGADHRRLSALLLADGLTVASAGALLGAALAATTLRVFGNLYLGPLALTTELRLGPAVIAFLIGLAALTGVALGVAPLVQLKRMNLLECLQQSSRSATRGNTGWARRSLVASQVALTFVLLTTAGLFVATVRNLLTVDPGYSLENVMTAAIHVPRERYADVTAASAFLDRALAAIRSVPGVASAGAATTIPLSGDRAAQSVITEDHPVQGDESLIAPNWVSVSPGFFATMETPILRGRYLDDRDNDASLAIERRLPRAVIVDETLARVLWPREDPLGKRMFLPGIGNALLVRDDTRWLTVVGVVPDLLLEALSGSGGTVGTFYTPYAESNRNAPPRDYGFVIKTAGDPALVMGAVRRAIADIDPELALFDTQTMVARRTLSLARERLAMVVAAGFAGIALFLSALGVYGVLSYLVAQRRRELGIRIALGSRTFGIFRLVLREGVGMVVAGLVVGAAGIVVLRPVLSSQIYGIGPSDPFLAAATAIVLTAVALAACLAPAYRATRVDPVVVLNEE